MGDPMEEYDVVVVGSCMVDLVSYASCLPQPGETIHGVKFCQSFGGKGANQCVAAARLGAKTALIAKVGDDSWGTNYIQNLDREHIDTKYVQQVANHETGTAQIIVSNTDGQNQIVIVSGANSMLNSKDVICAENIIKTAKVLVTQLEISPETAYEALKTAQGISILNGAPASVNLPSIILKAAHILCVNENEASTFTGLRVTTVQEAKIAARALIRMGCTSVILTLGQHGAIYVHHSRTDEVIHAPSPKVKCADSTGAGDAFIGALAYALATWPSEPMQKILEFACFVAADSVTKHGTQISFPHKDIIKKWSFQNQ